MVYSQTLLDLGASANYKDDGGLTPLYHAVMADSQAGPQCVQMLLFNRSDVGLVDASFNTELHQVSTALCSSSPPAGSRPDRSSLGYIGTITVVTSPEK